MFDSSGLRKATEGMIQINQNDGFLSPHVESADQTIGIFLKDKFTKLHHRQKQQIVKNVFHNLYGRHNAVKYKPQYNFRQRWQQQSKPTFFQGANSIVKSQNMMPPLMQLILLLMYASVIWFLTIYRLFNTHELVYILLPILILTQCKDVCLKQYFIRKAISQNHYSKSRLNWEDYLRIHWGNFIFLPYITFIGLENAFFNEKNMWFSLIDFVFIWRAYLRWNELYQSIKIRMMASVYRNQLQVVRLLTRCSSIIHFFGIILFYVSRINQTQNWTLKISDFNLSWASRYIFSLYFASTTLTTVGYGDITPKNPLQIATILIIQVFGIINFGYVINEIGRILAKINERQQILTKNISQAQNITQTYRIPQNLASQMRSYIINHQIAHDQLNVQEQDNFLRKLNDEIRQGFNQFHHIQIVKSSIFFLCHWSKKFQRKIASKLVRNIYSPQQSLIQSKGKEKLYILTRGKIDIIPYLADHLLPIEIRPLKVIQLNSKKEIHFNVFGYSQLVSGLQINLKAVVKDYSICYTLIRQDFTACIIEDNRDFQYFHQIKAKIQQSYFRQIWEAPNITNTREHYLPNPYYILMKNKHKNKKTNQRRQILRRYKKTKCYIQAQIQHSSQQIESQDSQQTTSRERKLIDKMWCENSITPQNEILSSKQRKARYDNILNANTNLYLIKNRGYNQRSVNKTKVFHDEEEKRIYEEQEAKQTILNNFEQCTNFYAYFPKFNYKKILDKYQKKYHKIYQHIRSQKSVKFQSKNLISDQVLQKLLNIKVFGSQTLE